MLVQRMQGYYPTPLKIIKAKKYIFWILAVASLLPYLIVWLDPWVWLDAKFKLACFLGPAAILYSVSFLWPGQLDLALSAEGFELHSWEKSYRRKYAWSEVAGFQVLPPGKVRIVVFNEGKKPSYNFLPFSYELNASELASLLNEWKQRYSPNPQLEMMPPLDPNLSQRQETWVDLLKIFAVTIGSFILILGCLAAILFWNSATRILLTNHSGAPLEKFAITAFPSPFGSPKVMHLGRFLHGKQVPVTIPHFDAGKFKMTYVDANHQPQCIFFMLDSAKTWSEDDEFIVEPRNHMTASVAKWECEIRGTCAPNRVLAGHCDVNAPNIVAIVPAGAKKELASFSSGLYAYGEDMKRKIRLHWHPPQEQKQRALKIGFIVLKDGVIQQGKILKSSGNPEMDQAGLDAIRKASPLPALPKAIDYEPLKVTLEMENGNVLPQAKQIFFF